jgi:SAM-dependent methyltransferase
MAEHHELYQRAFYYDIAMRRDIEAEIDFILAVYSHYTGQAMRSVLDLACGPGYHARAFARRGLQSAGLDLRPEMIRFAADRAAEDGVQVSWLAADMRCFKLEKPVDMAIIMFDSIDALVLNEDLVQHLGSVADNLTSGGLYLVDITHPREVDYDHYGDFTYGGERDGIRVEILWGTNGPASDLVSGIVETEIEIHIDDHGRQFVIKDYAKERMLFPQEIVLLAELSGKMKVVGWHGDYDITQPLDYSAKSRRMIAVLQKK